jgi:hypothetical protein
MGEITKRAVDALQAEPDRDVFAWDTELRGFGIRAKPSGLKTSSFSTETSKAGLANWYSVNTVC